MIYQNKSVRISFVEYRSGLWIIDRMQRRNNQWYTFFWADDLRGVRYEWSTSTGNFIARS